jgi:hypothetical protein
MSNMYLRIERKLYVSRLDKRYVYIEATSAV